MTDILTRFCLVGAAVLFAAWAAIVGGRWFTRQLAAMRPYLAAFLVFTFVAMNYAQKSGTNDPPRGASTCSTRSTWLNTPAPLFTLGSVATNETWDFSAPSGAEVHERWQRRGACDIVELWNYGIAEMRKWEAT